MENFSKQRKEREDTTVDTKPVRTFIYMETNMQLLFLEMKGERNLCVVVTFVASYSGR
jgi:hypothetical protein